MLFTLLLLPGALYAASVHQGDDLNQTYVMNQPTNWEPYCHDKKFAIGNQKVYWHQAFVLCQQNDMQLASISSEEEQAALGRLLDRQNMEKGVAKGYWTSAVRMGACNSEFVHFTSGKPVVFTKWARGQPDNAVEKCVEVFKEADNNYLWNDISCEGPYRLGYICQTKTCCVC